MTWKCLVFTGTFCICFKEILLKMSYRIPFEDIRQMSLIGVPENVSCKISSKHIRQNYFFKATFCTRFKDIFLNCLVQDPFKISAQYLENGLCLLVCFVYVLKSSFPKCLIQDPFKILAECLEMHFKYLDYIYFQMFSKYL